MNELIMRLNNIIDATERAKIRLQLQQPDTSPQKKAFLAATAMNEIHLCIDEFYAQTESFILQMAAKSNKEKNK